MIWTALTVEIASFVTEAHYGQTDKLGVPYIFHLMAVASPTQTEDETCVALLHDYAEDVVPHWTETQVRDQFKKLGLSSEAIEAILLLRHAKNEPYEKYIQKIKNNPLAKQIKIYDLNNNMDPERLNLLSDAETKNRLLKKYKTAMEMLK